MQNTAVSAARRSKTSTLVECAIMIALGTVLSLVKVWEMPLGGSITLLSMLPVCLISIRHGLKWGLASAFVYSLGQVALGFSSLMSWGLTPAMWVGTLLFDYIIAFTVLGLAGIFAKKGTVGICLGVGLAVFLRFVSHFISGVIIFDIWCPDGWNVALYSICYNGAYLLPEVIITMIAAPLVVKALARVKKN